MFTAVVRKASFGGAATELGTSPAYVSKRIRLLEQDLQVKLLHRTTRRVAVTEEGERVFHWAQRILDEGWLEQSIQLPDPVWVVDAETLWASMYEDKGLIVIPPAQVEEEELCDDLLF